MKKNKTGEVISLNQRLYSDFSMEQLEQRLETDPLLSSVIPSACGVIEGYQPCDAAYSPCGAAYDDSTTCTDFDACSDYDASCGISYILG